MVERWTLPFDFGGPEIVMSESGEYVRHSDYAALERQIVELRAKLTKAEEAWAKAASNGIADFKRAEAAEAENARLRALPLKDEVERVVEAMRSDPFIDDANLLGTTGQDLRMEHYARIAVATVISPSTENGETAARSVLHRIAGAQPEITLEDGAAVVTESVAIRAMLEFVALSRLRAGEQEGRDGLSEWAGWDKARDPWGETKHKDAVLEALFRGPWSVEDAAALIGFIDRTWTRRPAAPSDQGGDRG